MEEREAS